MDRRGAEKEIRYDAGDRAVEVRVSVGDAARYEGESGPAKIVARFGYDAAGNKVWETDVHGHETRYVLDSLYRVVKAQLPAVPGPALGGGATSYAIERRYDRAGNKVFEQDGNGDATRWTYDHANRVLETVDAVGRFERRAYDGDGLLVREEVGHRNAGGEESVHLTRTSKGHDGLGRPLGVREVLADAASGTRTFETAVAYDDASHAVEERDRRGFVTVRRLDDLDRVYEEVVDAAGTQLARTGESAGPPLALASAQEYDAAGNRSAFVDPLGRRTEEVYDGLARVTLRKLPMGVTEEVAYDGEGNAVRRKDRCGVETRHRYDLLGRETARHLVEARSNGGQPLALLSRRHEDAPDASGLVRVVELDALLRSTTHVLDALHREVKTLDATNAALETAYDAVRRRVVRDRRGHVTEYDPDAAGRPSAQRELSLGGAVAYAQSWAYDDDARTETWTDRRGMPTVTWRDGLGRVERVKRGAAPDQREDRTEYDGNGNAVAAVDPNGHRTEWVYDGANRRVSETRGAGTAAASTTAFKFDGAGNRTETKGPRGSWAFDVRESYDDLNRPVRTEVPTGDPAQPYAVTTRAFDGAGNKLCEKRPLGGDPLAGGAGGLTVAQVEGAACAGEQVTRYAYEEQSKLVSVVDASGGEHSFVYDAARNLLAKQDANGSLTTYRYDALYRRTDEWQHLDLHARVRSRGEVPDAFGEGPADPAHEAGALHWQADHDANGNVTERTDPKGVTVVARYGVLDRLETERYPDPFLNPTYPYPLGVTYAHDGNGNVELVSELKRTSAETTVEEERDPEYDGLGRLASERRYDGKVVTYGYDAKGNRTRVTDPDEVATTYTFDAQDRLETATTPQGVTRYRYWPDGLEKGTSHPNGLEEARCHDAGGRLTAIVTAREAIAETCATPGRLVSRFDYGYDANANRLTQLERRTDPVSQLLGETEETRYGYDAQDRLVAVAYPDDTAVLYRLDAVGNRTGERRALASKVAALTVAAFAALAPSDALGDLTATFNRADWLVAQVDAKDASRSATYAYDLAGNLTEKVKGSLHRDFRWSYRNTLTAVLDGGVEVGRYDYDADLQRVKRTTAAEEVEYVLDERHVLQEASASTGHPSYRRYHYAQGPLAVVDGAGTRSISTDALGSPTDLTGAGGTVASMRKYDAWGQYRSGTAPSASEPKLGFTGHQFDPETGLVYARARYYDADLGRFISRDTYEGALGDAPSLHRFAYAHGNPLVYVDEEGESATVLGTALGFAWGLGQAIGGLLNGNVEDAGDFLGVIAQNTMGGFELGLSIDLTAASGGVLLAAGTGALGFAGWDALTFDGKPKDLKDFAVSQVVEGGKGAVGGAAVGLAFKGVSAVGGAVAKTAAGQFVTRQATALVGKVANTAVGKAVASAVSAAGERVAVAGTRVANVAKAFGREADEMAAQVGVPGLPNLPGAVAQTLTAAETTIKREVAEAWREASTPWTGPGAVPAGTPLVPGQTLTNPIPARMARVIPAEFAGGARLGAGRANEVWVTAAEDLAGLTTSQGVAQRLTLVDQAGRLIPGPRAVIEFDAVAEGLASPVFRDAPGFVGHGRTAGGAREFVLPNLRLDRLKNVKTRIVE